MKVTRAKAWAALAVQVIGQALTLGLLPVSWRPYAELVVAAATVGTVYQVPNRPVTLPPAAGNSAAPLSHVKVNPPPAPPSGAGGGGFQITSGGFAFGGVVPPTTGHVVPLDDDG
jgi:hypothetical protein